MLERTEHEPKVGSDSNVGGVGIKQPVVSIHPRDMIEKARLGRQRGGWVEGNAAALGAEGRRKGECEGGVVAMHRTRGMLSVARRSPAQSQLNLLACCSANFNFTRSWCQSVSVSVSELSFGLFLLLVMRRRA